jgi:hypothetical protein
MAVKLNALLTNAVKEVKVEFPKLDLPSKVEGDHIEIRDGSILIEGRIIHRKRRQMGVTITSPFQNLTEYTGYIPLFSLPFYDFLGEVGDDRAIMILYSLYKFCVYASEHRVELLQALERYEEALHYATEVEPVRQQFKRREAELRAHMKELKLAWKEGRIEDKNYQRQETKLHRAIDELDAMTTVYEFYYFDEHFKAYEKTPVKAVRLNTAVEYLRRLRSGSD